MSKPIPNTLTQPLTFDQRVKLVQGEIKSRVAKTSNEQRNAARARMWVKWLERSVLEVSV